MNGNIGRINESIGVSFAVLSFLPDRPLSGRREGTQARERTRPLRKTAFFEGGVCLNASPTRNMAGEDDLIRAFIRLFQYTLFFTKMQYL
jgi:hypothetical protein